MQLYCRPSRSKVLLPVLICALVLAAGCPTETSTGTVATPRFSPASGTYTSVQHVYMTCATPGADIRYEINGNEPTEASTLCTAPVTISSTTTLKARAFKTDWVAGAVQTGVYTINLPKPDLAAGMIVISPSEPTVNDTVTLSASIMNNGNASAGAFTWKIKLDGNVVGSGRPATLAAHGTLADISATVGPLTLGQHQISFTVDTSEEVGESNEVNNSRGPIDFTVANAVATALTVLSPVDGDLWYTGHKATILWLSEGNVGGSVRVDLYCGSGTLSRTLSTSHSNVAGVNIFTFTVPREQTLGGDYYVQVKSISKSSVLDRSDGTFSVEAGVITFMLPGDVPLEMLWIPGGTFMMGSPETEQDRDDSEGPQHLVTVPGFWIGTYELTKGQWFAVMGTTPWAGEFGVLDDLDTPAVFVTWDDAQAFIAALNAYLGESFRLPSEAEWEYACRAGTTTRFYWGDDPNYTVGDSYCWWQYNAWDAHQWYAHVVGRKLPNDLGLFDMSGNVFELCQDYWHSNYDGAPTDGSAWETCEQHCTDSARVIRGGTWYQMGSMARSASRLGLVVFEGGHNNGFRLAR